MQHVLKVQYISLLPKYVKFISRVVFYVPFRSFKGYINKTKCAISGLCSCGGVKECLSRCCRNVECCDEISGYDEIDSTLTSIFIMFIQRNFNVKKQHIL